MPIRALSKLSGRLSFYERNIEHDPVDNNVDWEVGPSRGDVGNGHGAWRIDIVVDRSSIVEVKHYSNRGVVAQQLQDYIDWADDEYGVTFTANGELNAIGWAVKYEEPESLFGNTPTWYAWADPVNAGHVYFAREDENMPQWVREQGKHVGESVDSIFDPIPLPGRVPTGPGSGILVP